MGSMAEIVQSVADILNHRYSITSFETSNSQPTFYGPPSLFTTVMYPRGTNINLDIDRLKELGILTVVEVASSQDEHGRTVYQPDALIEKLQKTIEGQKMHHE